MFDKFWIRYQLWPKNVTNQIIQIYFIFTLALRDYGRLRKDAELKVQSHADQGKIKTRYVFVFDKVLLMCKSTRGDHYSFKDSLKLTEYKLQEARWVIWFKNKPENSFQTMISQISLFKPKNHSKISQNSVKKSVQKLIQKFLKIPRKVLKYLEKWLWKKPPFRSCKTRFARSKTISSKFLIVLLIFKFPFVVSLETYFRENWYFGFYNKCIFSWIITKAAVKVSLNLN